MLVLAAQEWGALVSGFGDELEAAAPIALRGVGMFVCVYLVYRIMMTMSNPFK